MTPRLGIAAAIVVLSLPVASFAQNLSANVSENVPLPTKTIPETRNTKFGKQLFVTSYTVVCGPLEAQYPFDPATFGKVRGWNPVGSEDTKIVLFTRALDARFFRLAAAVDKLVAKDARLAASQVIVIDDKGAQYGSYTVEEIQARQKEIRGLVRKHDVSHLTFFLSGQGAGGMLARLGLTPPAPSEAFKAARANQEDTNLLLLYMVETTPRGRFCVLRWSTPVQTERLDPQTIAETMDLLKTAIAAK